MNRTRWILAASVILLVALDQVVKQWARDYLKELTVNLPHEFDINTKKIHNILHLKFAFYRPVVAEGEVLPVFSCYAEQTAETVSFKIQICELEINEYFFFVALKPDVGASRPHSLDKPQTVGLLWTRDQPDTETST